VDLRVYSGSKALHATSRSHSIAETLCPPEFVTRIQEQNLILLAALTAYFAGSPAVGLAAELLTAARTFDCGLDSYPMLKASFGMIFPYNPDEQATREYSCRDGREYQRVEIRLHETQANTCHDTQKCSASRNQSIRTLFGMQIRKSPETMADGRHRNCTGDASDNTAG
jgi:hypothetical protein